jgi:sterol 3beta-glucosyltransferase
MFTDAALYERVLTAGPESIKTCLLSEATSEEALPMCIGSFNELIGRDLADEERMVTGRLAKLSVNNWDASGDDPFGVDGLSEEDQGEAGSPDRSEDEKPSRLMTSSPTVEEEQPEEPKLTSEEVIDLLEQEFGALAAPGEEKLLLETDAAFFKDVVILVGPPPAICYRVMAYVFLSYFRVSFTSLRIDSLFMLRSYRRSRATMKRL